MAQDFKDLVSLHRSSIGFMPCLVLSFMLPCGGIGLHVPSITLSRFTLEAFSFHLVSKLNLLWLTTCVYFLFIIHIQ